MNDQNTYIGYTSGNYTTTGHCNTAYGYESLVVDEETKRLKLLAEHRDKILKELLDV